MSTRWALPSSSLWNPCQTLIRWTRPTSSTSISLRASRSATLPSTARLSGPPGGSNSERSGSAVTRTLPVSVALDGVGRNVKAPRAQHPLDVRPGLPLGKRRRHLGVLLGVTPGKRLGPPAHPVWVGRLRDRIELGQVHVVRDVHIRCRQSRSSTVGASATRMARSVRPEVATVSTSGNANYTRVIPASVRNLSGRCDP